MPEETPSGDNWEDHVTGLCHIQCMLRGESYQPIPDQVDGDGGLEGITTDGWGYQCYSDQNTLTVAERLRKQKKKITNDLGKLKKYQEFWKSIFGTEKLKRWFLLTPDVPDKAILAHARRQAKKLRDSDLPFIDPSFEALVVTDAHFQQAKDWRTGMSLTVVDVPPDDVPQSELARIESRFVANTDRKLKQVRPNDSDAGIELQRNRYLRWHLDCENILSKIFARDSELWERLKNFCAQQKANVEFESSVDDARPHHRLMNVQKSMAADLDRDFKVLGKATLSAISRGSIASWLGLCPLEFVTGE